MHWYFESGYWAWLRKWIKSAECARINTKGDEMQKEMKK